MRNVRTTVTRASREDLVSNCRVSLGQDQAWRGLEVLTTPDIVQDYGNYHVLPGQSVDPALHKNQPELGIPVLPVPLQMLPDGDGLLDKVVDVLGQGGSHPLTLQDTEDLVTGDESHLQKYFNELQPVRRM